MLLRALFSHYRRHPLQLVALWLILSLATALWTGVWTLTQQARTSMTAGEEQLSGRQQVVRADGTPVTREDFVALRRQGLCVMPWLEVTPADGGPRQVGVDGLSMGCAGEAAVTGGGLALDGRPFVDVAEAVRQIREEGALGQLRLHRVANDERPLPETWRMRPETGQLSTGQLADSFLLNLDALSLLVLLITGLMVRSVYTLGLAQRREGFGLLVRYGVPMNRLRRRLLLELLVLGLLALVPGLWLGLQLASALSAGFASALGNLFDTPLLATAWSATSVLAVVGVMALVLLWAALDLLRGPTTNGAWGRLTGPVAATPLVLVGLVCVVWLQDLVWIFLGTGLLLAGIGLLTPTVLRLLAGGAGSDGTAPGPDPLRLWRQRETGVLARRLGLPLVALQLAVATVIAVQALVTTFEDTFYQWLGQRLSGDLYVEVPQGRTPDQVRAALDSSEAIRHWHPVIRGQALLTGADGRPAAVDVMATDPGSPMMQTWEMLTALPAAWQQLEPGQGAAATATATGVMINEQLARRYDLQPGDHLMLDLEGDTALTVLVAGIYADYGRPAGELILSWQHLPEAFRPRYQSLTLGLVPDLAPDRYEALRDQLRNAWGVAELQERDNATIERIAVAIFDQTFALTRAISFLTLALASAALLMTGWVVLRSRAWYLHLLAAWGLSPGQTRRLLRALMTGLMVRLTLVSIPPGVMLTWILVARINPVAFGWSLPMAVYPLFWLQLMAILVAIGLAVAWRIARGLVDGQGRPAVPRGTRLVAGGIER